MFWKNEEENFLKCYKQYADAIYRHCYFRVHNKELAEDLTQMTFIKTWKYIADGGKVKNMKAFLYKIAGNLTIDNSRKKKPLPLDDFSPKDQDRILRLNNIGGEKEEDIFRNFEGERAIKLLDRLNEKQKQALIMRYIDDLLPSEIADILEESPNAVSVRINQAMNRLREIVKEEYDYGKEYKRNI